MTIGIEHVNDYPLIRFEIRFKRKFRIRRTLLSPLTDITSTGRLQRRRRKLKASLDTNKQITVVCASSWGTQSVTESRSESSSSAQHGRRLSVHQCHLYNAGSPVFFVTLCCLATASYGYPCRTLLYQHQCVLLHFDQFWDLICGKVGHISH